MRYLPLFPAIAFLPAMSEAQEADARAVLLTGSRVVTMQGGWTDPEPMDILVEDGRIAAMDEGLDAGDAEAIDLSDHLIAPGLVDGHWHMWNSIARGHERTDDGGFADAMKPLSAAWTPEASALSVELAAALAVNGGITWANNWAHNVKAPEFAEAGIAAMEASGLKGRFS
ncbi:hypothetical protein [Mangrovicoccus sp. HB161399]|uniref:hypothetical protein n=1 Tax=Mangrovicoccus sp. HB161399 TaxID=2720392 RepID=UPI00155223B4|nr:hypothetical protein [Mangrovicoccus sp. HB161399]